jgi:hypothetical protein
MDNMRTSIVGVVVPIIVQIKGRRPGKLLVIRYQFIFGERSRPWPTPRRAAECQIKGWNQPWEPTSQGILRALAGILGWHTEKSSNDSTSFAIELFALLSFPASWKNLLLDRTDSSKKKVPSYTKPELETPELSLDRIFLPWVFSSPLWMYDVSEESVDTGKLLAS